MKQSRNLSGAQDPSEQLPSRPQWPLLSLYKTFSFQQPPSSCQESLLVQRSHTCATHACELSVFKMATRIPSPDLQNFAVPYLLPGLDEALDYEHDDVLDVALRKNVGTDSEALDSRHVHQCFQALFIDILKGSD